MRSRLALLLPLALVLGGAVSRAPAARHEQELAYVRKGEIHVLSLRSGRDRVVGRGAAPAWSPDGSRLAFVDVRRSRFALRSAGADGRGARRLTPWLRFAHDYGGSPPVVWSPDGSRIAFARSETGAQELFTVAASGGGLRRLLRRRYLGKITTLEWLPSGDLAFCTTDSLSRWKIAATGGRLRNFTDRPTCQLEPLASPYRDLRLLARADARNNFQIVLATAAGRTLRKLTNDVPVDPLAHFRGCCPVWSRDGRRVAFLSDRVRPGDDDLFVVRSDGRDERRLTWNAAVILPPALSPDGTLVGFVRHAGTSRWDLYAVATSGGRPRLLARGVESGPVWRPGPRPRLAPRPRPRPLRPHYVRVVRRLFYRGGRGRLVDRRRFSSRSLELAEISPDGARLSLGAYPVAGHFRFPVGYVDLRSSRTRILTWGAAGREFAVGGEFSRDGRLLLFRRWRRLLAVDVETGRVSFVADDPATWPIGWLADGRVAFVDRRRRLMVVRPGRRPHPTGFTAADPPGYDDLGRITWSPDGTKVLYGRRCGTWLLDLRTGRRRRVGGEYTAPGQWSPDGRYFLLPYGTWAESCRLFSTPLWGGQELHGRGGRRLGSLPGGWSTWSTDGRHLVFFGGVSGTAVTYLQPLSVLNLRTHRLATLFANRNGGSAFLGPGGWLVYSRYDRSRLPPDRVEKLVPVRTYVARLLEP